MMKIIYIKNCRQEILMWILGKIQEWITGQKVCEDLENSECQEAVFSLKPRWAILNQRIKGIAQIEVPIPQSVCMW